MKRIHKYTLPLLLLFGSVACDKVDDPYADSSGISISLGEDTEYIVDPSLNITTAEELLDLLNNNSWDSTLSPDNSNQRFIVLEEFTGHTCINCFLGTDEVVRLDGEWGDQLIPVGIHAGNFAEPLASGDKYRTDHRDPDLIGDEYSRKFNPGNQYPRGMVSRLGGAVSEVSNWQLDIAELADDAPKASLLIKNYYAAANNLLRINVELKWKEDLTDPYNLLVYVVEDHITDWQKVLADDVEEYDHRHVLRKVVNSETGKSLNAALTDSIQKIEYILPLNPSWKANDIESVAFIFNNDGSSFEIIQGNAAYLIDN